MTVAAPVLVAHRLLAKGLNVFPVPRPIPGTPPHTPGDGKTPALKWKPYQSEPVTPDLINTWFAEPQNIAILTGAISGVVVLDVDAEAALRWVVRTLPHTPWQTRTARGRHFYYRHPGGVVRGTVHAETAIGKLALDVRGDGNYVIAPSSVHASGAVYRADGNWRTPREILPVFSRSWISAPPVPEPPVKRELPRDRDCLERARHYLAAVPVPVIGQGSDRATFIAACRLVRGFELSPSDAEHLLWEWCGHRDGWTRDWVAAKIHSALHNGSEPFGGLR